MITQNGNSLELKTPCDAGFVAALKTRIPADGRKWDAARKLWLVDVAYSAELAQLLKMFFRYSLKVQPAQSVIKTELVQVEYIGACKDRGNGEPSAFGYSGGDWSLVFPESVLRGWFEFGAKPTPGAAKTLYGWLSIKQSADAAEVKTAYRRLAKQWHPDVCREANAAEMFRAIQHAYEVLSDAQQRRRYDAGLALAATVREPQKPVNTEPSYRSPLRCGWLLVEGRAALGRLAVEKILQWEDITDAFGRVMVSSWPAGAEKFEVSWV